MHHDSHRNDRCDPSRPPGFSLVEVVMVVVIVAALSAIAVPRYVNSLVRYRLDVAAQRIVADLEYARQLARTSGTSKTIQFKVATDAVQLVAVPGLDDPSAVYQTALSDAPYRVALDSTTFGAENKVIYDGYGMPDTGGTAQISIGSDVRTITIDANTGKATYQ